MFHLNCSLNERVCAGRKNKLETEGGSRVKGDSNTIPKNRLYLLQLCLRGFLCRDSGDSRFQRALANGSWCQKSFSKSLSLSNWLPHCSIVQPHTKCSGSRVWMSMSEKMHTGRAPKATQRVQNSPQHVLQPPEAIQFTNWVKVYPGSGAIFLGHQRSHWVT